MEGERLEAGRDGYEGVWRRLGRGYEDKIGYLEGALGKVCGEF